MCRVSLFLIFEEFGRHQSGEYRRYGGELDVAGERKRWRPKRVFQTNSNISEPLWAAETFTICCVIGIKQGLLHLYRCSFRASLMTGMGSNT